MNPTRMVRALAERFHGPAVLAAALATAPWPASHVGLAVDLTAETPARFEAHNRMYAGRVEIDDDEIATSAIPWSAAVRLLRAIDYPDAHLAFAELAAPRAMLIGSFGVIVLSLAGTPS